MSVSLKCQYGLRALFELARRTGSAPTRIQEIAEAQQEAQRVASVIGHRLEQATDDQKMQRVAERGLM